MNKDDFLVEVRTEELPPKTLNKLAKAFEEHIKSRLLKAGLTFKSSTYYATPRRLAVEVTDLDTKQPDQEIERKGPALSAAFDDAGNPSAACLGFARSCGVTPQELITLKTNQGEWVGFREKVTGKTVQALLPSLIEQALSALPIPKRMRWGEGEIQFIRPVHGVILLYGDQVIEATILGCKTGRVTRGHRFLSPDGITIPTVPAYSSLLKSEGFVIASFSERRNEIRKQASACVQKKLGDQASVLITSDELLDEITGLVEWPVALCGQFDAEFLNLPEEVLISSMQDHQRYFPVVDERGKLLPYFVTICNIKSHDVNRVIHGNECVLRARLSDAAFFYAADKKESLEQRAERLKDIIFQAKLGSLFDKTERLSQLAVFIAKKMNANLDEAQRAGFLAKTDLTTDMVNEFPALQGVMGYYYAKDHETDNVACALKEQYLPRFAGDLLPKKSIGQILALADRMDTLVGAFGINQIPTGDKDPYGLRRAAVGVLRILIEKEINLDLNDTLQFAVSLYAARLENPETIAQVLNFIQERLRSWYQEQGLSADVFTAVAALGGANPLDMHQRIQAVRAFKKLGEAEALSIANKRVNNILTKYVDTIEAKTIDPTFFEHAAEQELARQLEVKGGELTRLCQAGDYEKMLLQLAELRQPVDDFFDQVMVMTEDKAKRENRLLLLSKLRALFLQVADIALLQ